MSTKQASNPVIVIIMASSDMPIPASVSNSSLQIANLDSATCSPQCLPDLIDDQNYAMTNHTLQPNPTLTPGLGSTLWSQGLVGTYDFTSSLNSPDFYAPFNPECWTNSQQTWMSNSPFPSMSTPTSLRATTEGSVRSVDRDVASMDRR